MNIYINFKQGDLVFGLLEPRDEVSKELRKRGFCDTYSNALNDPAVALVMKNASPEEVKKKLSISQQRHFHFLDSHKLYLSRKPGRTVPAMLHDPIDGAAYRRACKLLLVDRSPDRKHSVHIVTKGIDWHRVCDKKKSGLGVTDSELRAVFRDELRNGPNPHIFFYDENLNLLPKRPWEEPEIKRIFADYHTHISSKDKASAAANVKRKKIETGAAVLVTTSNRGFYAKQPEKPALAKPAEGQACERKPLDKVFSL